MLFESVFEGLIAIDSDYKITAINQTARRLLNLSQPEPTLIGKRISSVISQEVFFYDAPQTNKKRRDRYLQSDQSDRQPDGGDLKQ
ncbi:hypothetical protein IE986_14415 [Klebsiella pneumoniae]|uniref:Uncharacterized protein n=1 Tax=Klebsiella pneumoniae TaxID=573 RepID=A0A927DCY9_KLEPN|nr:hypothetical protein [Klebsiella pneumoniae]